LARGNKSREGGKATKKREIRQGLTDGPPERRKKMADDAREDPGAVVKAFLQHKSLEQTQDYLVRGRRFAKFDERRLDHCC